MDGRKPYAIMSAAMSAGAKPHGDLGGKASIQSPYFSSIRTNAPICCRARQKMQQRGDPSLERSCHSLNENVTRVDQILCGARSGRRRKRALIIMRIQFCQISNWHALGSSGPACQSMLVSAPRGMAPPVVGCGNGLEVQRDHVRCSDELRGAISLHGTRSLTVVVIRLRYHHGKP